MLASATFDRLKRQVPACQLTQIGCFYVVSVKTGPHQLASSPQKTIQAAVEEFEVKYAVENFDLLAEAG